MPTKNVRLKSLLFGPRPLHWRTGLNIDGETTYLVCVVTLSPISYDLIGGSTLENGPTIARNFHRIFSIQSRKIRISFPELTMDIFPFKNNLWQKFFSVENRGRNFCSRYDCLSSLRFPPHLARGAPITRFARYRRSFKSGYWKFQIFCAIWISTAFVCNKNEGNRHGDSSELRFTRFRPIQFYL